jgi:hypothetical protein
MLILTGRLLIFIPKKLSDFLESTHQEMAHQVIQRTPEMAGEKIMLSVYPALNHDG